jgi:hypothetical protein
MPLNGRRRSSRSPLRHICSVFKVSGLYVEVKKFGLLKRQNSSREWLQVAIVPSEMAGTVSLWPFVYKLYIQA